MAWKHDIPARMWRHGIHSFLEFLRFRLPVSLDYMLSFIHPVYPMMALPYERVLSLPYRLILHDNQYLHSSILFSMLWLARDLGKYINFPLRSKHIPQSLLIAVELAIPLVKIRAFLMRPINSRKAWATYWNWWIKAFKGWNVFCFPVARTRIAVERLEHSAAFIVFQRITTSVTYDVFSHFFFSFLVYNVGVKISLSTKCRA